MGAGAGDRLQTAIRNSGAGVVRAVVIGCAASLALASCTHSGARCGGIAPASLYEHAASLAPDQRARRVLLALSSDRLQCWAARGDKAAAFALGISHEEGVGGAVDLTRARRYYRLAAATDVEERSFYAAPVGNQAYTVPVRVPLAIRSRGLQEARAALVRVDEKLRAQRSSSR